ncbi:MAG: GlsB/YeaQ/YmgE family stress response membrane protein [Candidatus Acidiferrales bacterium]
MTSMAAWFAGPQRPMSQHDVVVYVETHSIFWWLLIGLIAGWLAGTVARGRGFGCVVDVILGLVGAVIGGWIFERLNIPSFGFWGSLAAATVGAIVLVAIARLFAGGRSD